MEPNEIIEMEEVELKAIPRSDRELLLETVWTLRELKTAFKEASTGEGFTRCVLHTEKIENLEDGVNWLKKLVYITGGSAIVLIVVGVLSFVFPWVPWV